MIRRALPEKQLLRDGPGIHDESGMLSLDFMVGLSIFMIAFIIVATMTSGLLVGLQSRTIDYDAVAYRTGVVLAEDPGEIEEMVGISYIAPDRYAWDLIYPEYYAQYRESNVMRMGLMIPRYYYDTPPRVLLAHKVDTFFSPPSPPGYDSGYYQDKIIFGNYPYRFNISLQRVDGLGQFIPKGDPVPANTTVGYIRRVVLVKYPREMNINNLFLENASGFITINVDFRDVSSGDPAYMIYPSLERDIINFTSCFPGPDTYNLTYLQVCSPTCEDPETGPPSVVLKNYANPSYERRFPWIGLGMIPEPVNNTTYLEIEPGYFSRRYFPTIGPVDSIDVKLRIEAWNTTTNSESANTTFIGGTYDYYYTLTAGGYVTNPPLYPAILEVRVW